MIRVEMHLHSNYSSDSRLSFEDIVAACRDKNIDIVCITDHNTLDGALTFKEVTGFPVVLGEEVKTTEGEVTGYFLSRNISPGMSIEETIKAIKDQGGIVCVPHPFDTYRKSRLKEGVLDRIIDSVDLIEVFNSRNLSKEADSNALEYCKKHGKIPIVGSDAHTVGEVGKAQMLLKDDFSDAKSFMEALKTAEHITKRSFVHVHFITKWEKWKAKNK